MGIVRRSHLADIDLFPDGSIGPCGGAFKQYLNQRRYAAKTVVTYLRCITHFARWAHFGHRRRERIDEVLIAEFLDEHLPQCECPGPIRRDRGDHSAALGHLLVVLRAQGVIAVPANRATPVDEELRRYNEYMDHVRGLAPKTRSIALRIVGRLLTARFGEGAVDVAAIKPEHVRRFFAGQAKLYSKPANAGSVVASLRGYFRYRASLAIRALFKNSTDVKLEGQVLPTIRSRAEGISNSPTLGEKVKRWGELTDVDVEGLLERLPLVESLDADVIAQSILATALQTEAVPAA